MMNLRPALVTAALLLTAPAMLRPAPAAASPPGAEFRGPLVFHADAASFPGPDGTGETFLYVTVPFTSLRFVSPEGAPPVAGVRIVAEFTDGGGRRIAGDEWVYRDVPDGADPEENGGRSLARRYRFRLPPGETAVRVRVEDLEGEGFGELVFGMDVPAFADAELAVSDLVFGVCGEAAESAPAGNPRGPASPHPSRRYGEDAPAMCVTARFADRLEVPDPVYAVRYEIRDAGGRRREKGSAAVTRTDRRGELRLESRLDGLGLGRYRLAVTVEVGGRKVEREGWFEVDESRVSVLEDEQMIRTVLGYVATNEELIRLENEPADSLEAIYRRFWARRDPTPDTRHNEALVEFMKRVDHATRRFGVLEPGWRSDRGRIYIRFGPPDQVEQVLDDSAGPAAEIWYYYGRNATFVFQDLDGFGRYVLSRTLRD